MSETFRPTPESVASPEQPKLPERKTPEQTRSFPEVVANPRLPDITLVYSIPFMREWKNGNLLRTLKAFFAQRTAAGESLEVELIANSGPFIESLLAEDSHTRLRQDVAFVLEGIPLPESRPLITNPRTPKEQHAMDVLQETQEAVAFVTTVIRAQHLARTGDTASQTELDLLRDQITDPLQKGIVERAVERASQISLMLVDATTTLLESTSYRQIGIDQLRTLGLDIASTRFEGNDQIVMGLYDADTYPENNHALYDTQRLFQAEPRLTYVFSGMSNAVPGTAHNVFTTGPSENVTRTAAYNREDYRGSPQILFRLGAYKKLKEISGASEPGFYHDEDRDTALKLMYHFGSLQDGLLFEGVREIGMLPSVLTGDRIDGSVDAVGRKESLAKPDHIPSLIQDLQVVFAFQETMISLIEKESPERQQEIHQFLGRARTEYQTTERLQQRMNRRVARTLLRAQTQKIISVEADQLLIDEAKLLLLPAGTATAHYLRTNALFVREMMQSQDTIDVLSYLVGLREQLPDHIKVLTPEQAALREYVGDLSKTPEVLYDAWKEDSDPANPSDTGWRTTDKRTPSSKASVMHSMIAESLALGMTYRTFFETSQLEEKRKTWFEMRSWPENPEDQQLEQRFGDQEQRLAEVRKRLPSTPTQDVKPPQFDVQPSPVPWYQQMRLKSVPAFRFLKRLLT